MSTLFTRGSNQKKNKNPTILSKCVAPASAAELFECHETDAALRTLRIVLRNAFAR
jgi:hypothetical protein